MKKILKLALSAACVMGMAACQGGGTDVKSDKEEALERAATPYVNNTVVATYRAMADAGVMVEWIPLESLINGYGAAHCMTQVLRRGVEE